MKLSLLSQIYTKKAYKRILKTFEHKIKNIKNLYFKSLIEWIGVFYSLSLSLKPSTKLTMQLCVNQTHAYDNLESKRLVIPTLATPTCHSHVTKLSNYEHKGKGEIFLQASIDKFVSISSNLCLLFYINFM